MIKPKKRLAKHRSLKKNVHSAYVQEQGVAVEDGKVTKVGVNLKITFEQE